VFDVVRRHHGCDFKAALELLGVGNGSPGTRPTSNTGSTPLAAGGLDAQDARNGAGLTIDTPQNEIDASRAFPSVEAVVEAVVEGVVRETGVGTHGGQWTYQDSDGSPAMVVVRIDTPKPGDPDAKTFRPVHPTADGWTFGDPPGPLPLYGLSDLDGAGLVVVVEGERCVEAARSIGFVATTSAHGASSPGKSDWTPLAGRDVVILPDADKAGHSYAESVARTLAGLDPPARVKVVALPGLPDKGDIVQYIDACEGVDSTDIVRGIESLVAAATGYTPTDPAPTADPWSGTSIGELWRSDRLWTPVRYIGTGLRWLDARLGGGLRTRGVHLFAGKTGHAKSQLAVQVAVNAAIAGVPVGFFSLELGADEVAQLIMAALSGIPRMILATGALDSNHAARLREAMTQHSGMPLTILDDEKWDAGLTRDGLATLVANGVTRFGWKLVVFDYLGLLVPSENDRDQYDTDVRNSTELKRIARKNDVALLVVAAFRKGATFRESAQLSIDDLIGAGRLAYDAQTVVVVSRELGEDDCGLVKVRPLKLRFAPCDESSPDVQLRWRPRTGLITDLETSA